MSHFCESQSSWLDLLGDACDFLLDFIEKSSSMIKNSEVIWSLCLKKVKSPINPIIKIRWLFNFSTIQMIRIPIQKQLTSTIVWVMIECKNKFHAKELILCYQVLFSVGVMIWNKLFTIPFKNIHSAGRITMRFLDTSGGRGSLASSMLFPMFLSFMWWSFKSVVRYPWKSVACMYVSHIVSGIYWEILNNF